MHIMWWGHNALPNKQPPIKLSTPTVEHIWKVPKVSNFPGEESTIFHSTRNKSVLLLSIENETSTGNLLPKYQSQCNLQKQFICTYQVSGAQRRAKYHQQIGHCQYSVWWLIHYWHKHSFPGTQKWTVSVGVSQFKGKKKKRCAENEMNFHRINERSNKYEYLQFWVGMNHEMQNPFHCV